MQTREIEKIQKAELVAGSLDLTTFAIIFSMFLKDTWRNLFMESWRYVLFPVSAAISVVQAVLAWCQMQLNKNTNGSYKNNLLTNAAIATASSMAVISALLISFVFTTVSAIVAPIIFTALSAIRGLFHAGSAFYYWGKSAFAKAAANSCTSEAATIIHNEDINNPAVQAKITLLEDKAAELTRKAAVYRGKAYTNAVSATSAILTSAAIFAVMLLAKPMFAIIGLVAGGIGAGQLVHATYKMAFPKRQEQGYQRVPNNEPNDDAAVAAAPGVAPAQRRLSTNAQMNQVMATAQPAAPAAAPAIPAANDDAAAPAAAPAVAQAPEATHVANNSMWSKFTRNVSAYATIANAVVFRK